jgi:hypothetical protein
MDDSTDFSETTQRTEKILNDYVPILSKDTVTILRSFLEFLPNSGRLHSEAAATSSLGVIVVFS